MIIHNKKLPKNVMNDETNKPLIDAVAYARFSSDNQREESIEAQVRAIKYYAQNFGFNIIRVYADRAKTGRSDDRPQFLKMMEDSKRGEFEAVLVHKLDRFSRNPGDTNYYEKILNDNGVKLISVIEQLDDTPEGQLMKQIIIGMNSFYSANLAREVRKGLKENAMNGKFTGGKVNYGYKVVNGKYEIHEKHASAVRRMFELCIRGIGKGRIAKMLNEEGYRTQQGKYLSPRTIFDILRNEKYVGRFTYNIGDETIVSEDVIPAIIDDETWLKAQEELKKHDKPKYGTHTQQYYLTGRILCGECGQRYSGGGSRKGRFGATYYYYKCNGHKNMSCDNTSINKDTLERLILDEIGEKILEDEVINKIANEAVENANRKIEEPTISLDDLKKEEAILKTKIDRLMDLYLEGEMSKEILNKKSSQLENELDIVKINIRKAMALKSTPKLKKEDFVDFLKSYRLDTQDEELSKSLLDTFVDSVIIYYDRIKINFKIDFDILGGGKLKLNNTSSIGDDNLKSVGTSVRNSGAIHTFATNIKPIKMSFTYTRHEVKYRYYNKMPNKYKND